MRLGEQGRIQIKAWLPSILFQMISGDRKFRQSFVRHELESGRSVFGLVVGKQGGIHESYINHTGMVVLGSKPFPETQVVGRFFKLHSFPQS